MTCHAAAEIMSRVCTRSNIVVQIHQKLKQKIFQSRISLPNASSCKLNKLPHKCATTWDSQACKINMFRASQCSLCMFGSDSEPQSVSVLPIPTKYICRENTCLTRTPPGALLLVLIGLSWRSVIRTTYMPFVRSSFYIILGIANCNHDEPARICSISRSAVT